MSSTITIDAAGRFVLPKSMRERLNLHAGSKLKADIVADKIELTPEVEKGVKLVRKGRRLVVTGLEGPFDAAKAVKAARGEHDDRLARRVRGRR